MNKRQKKKLLRRLNIRKWSDAPNIVNITDHNRYHKKHNDFMCALHGHFPPGVDETDTNLSNTVVFYTGSISEEEKW